MNASAQAPWWADRVFGLVSVTVGAILGFLASQAKDWLDAKRSRKFFLIAVAHELSTIRKQLQHSNDELTAAQDRFLQRGTPPQFSVLFSTTIFSSQITRLRNLSDPLLLDTVNFYSTLPQLQELAQLLNQQANEYLQLADPQQRDQAGIRLRSALRVILEETAKYQRSLDGLLPRLPN